MLLLTRSASSNFDSMHDVTWHNLKKKVLCCCVGILSLGYACHTY